MMESGTQLPNVIFVFADQLRASSVGCYGQEPVRTPNIDRFAEQGCRFPVAVASPSICGPYRGCLISGQNPLSNGVITNDVALRVEHKTLGECFLEAGYSTAYIGKWHLDGPDRVAWIPKGSRRCGFEYWAAANFEHNYLNSKFYRDGPEKYVWEGYDAEAQINELLNFVDSQSGNENPFMAVLSWGPPHNPYRMVPKKYLDLYEPNSLRAPPNCDEFPTDDLWGYYAQISFLDEQFGRLLEHIETLGLAENTLIVFTSDHGDMHGAHGVYKKGWPWDESIKVPMIMRLPNRIANGSRAEFPISTIDIMPTLLGICGLAVPQEVEGIDCSGPLLGTAANGPQSVLITNPCPSTILDDRGEDMVPTFRGRRMEYRGVRTMRHTYVESIDGPWLLYDNHTDPYQLNNLIDKQSHRALQHELASQMRAHMRRIGDEFLPKEEYYDRFDVKVDDLGVLLDVIKNPYPANA